MDATILLLFGVIAVSTVFLATAIGGSIDALAQPREAWERAELSRGNWVWQAFGVFFLPAMVVYSGLYFARVRPRLVAAARDLAIEQGAARAHLLPADVPAGPHVDTIKIRIPLPVVGVIALPFVVLVGFDAGVLTADSGGPTRWVQWVVWGLAALLAAGNLAFGVTLTTSALIMRGLIRRHVAWSDVAAITRESTLGSRYVLLWTRTGRGRRLRAPVAQLGIGRRRFDTDFAVLEQWWLTHAPATD